MAKLIAWGQRVTRANPQPPGNTLPIIDLAYELGYDGIELDVQVSKDGLFVLMHDHTLDATTDHKNRVANLTAAELKQIQVKHQWGHFGGPVCYIETLEAALTCNGNRGYVMVDSYFTNDLTIAALKSAVAGAAFDPALLLLLTHGKEGGRMLKQAYPNATVLLKAPHDAFPPNLSLSFASEAIGLDGVIVPTANFIDATIAFRKFTAKLGLKLAVYLQGDDLSQLITLMSTNPDFITADAPHIFKQAREMVNPIDARWPNRFKEC